MSEIPNSQFLQRFTISGTLEHVNPLKRGHLHDTYVSQWKTQEGIRRYVHQRINNAIFQDIPGLMNNIRLVTNHIRNKIPPESVTEETTLQIVPGQDGELFLADIDGGYWRTYEFVEGTEAFDVCRTREQALVLGAFVARFHLLVADLSPRSLIDPIPYFQNLPRRAQALEQVIVRDPVQRVRDIKSELNFATERAPELNQIEQGLERGELSLRVTHGDPKLNNVLFSIRSKTPICMVDLDTCMAGSLLYDIGDLIRNTAVQVQEDEQDFSKVVVDLDQFEALVKGYLKAGRSLLNSAEIELIPVSAKLLALALGIRFLTDHLDGDRYFKIHHPGHNLERARTQFALVRNFELQESKLRGIVSRLSAATATSTRA